MLTRLKQNCRALFSERSKPSFPCWEQQERGVPVTGASGEVRMKEETHGPAIFAGSTV